jgi:hypothetical protein
MTRQASLCIIIPKRFCAIGANERGNLTIEENIKNIPTWQFIKSVLKVVFDSAF